MYICFFCVFIFVVDLFAKLDCVVWPRSLYSFCRHRQQTSQNSLKMKQRKVILPWRLIWNLKMDHWKRIFLLETIIFRLHVSLGGVCTNTVRSTRPVVSNIFFHTYLRKIPILTNIFQRGWNHQPVIFRLHVSFRGSIYFACWLRKNFLAIFGIWHEWCDRWGLGPVSDSNDIPEN